MIFTLALTDPDEGVRLSVMRSGHRAQSQKLKIENSNPSVVVGELQA
jgi:hypothetical protein